MKRTLLLATLLSFGTRLAFSQVAINTENSAPDSCAILDISSSVRGILIPRMTSVQRMAISSPVEGLLVYDTDGDSFYYYSTNGWISLRTARMLADTDGDTKIEVEEMTDEDIVRMDVNGTEVLVLRANGHGDVLIDPVGTYQNTFFGAGSGHLNTGNYNTAFGDSALYSNTGSFWNTAIGFRAMYSNTTGYQNTASGFRALQSNTIGYANTASGFHALYSNTIGDYNTAIGNLTLTNNTTGHSNTATGRYALADNTTGYHNTATGTDALAHNTTGNSNTALGRITLYFNTTGIYNTAVGHEALANNSSTDNNTACGYRALFSSTANNNTAYGSEALLFNTSGFENVAVGFQALFYNTVGFRNIAVGHDALLNNTTGDQRTAFGHSSNSVGADYINSTGLGYNADCTAANQVRIGNGSVTSIGGFEPWTDLSDSRFKRDIRENVKGLEFILRLRPVTYYFDQYAMEDFMYDHYGERDTAYWPTKYDASTILRTGFIAQEVKSAAESVGYDFSGVDAPKNDDDFYGLRYAVFTVPLVKAVQEQQVQIEELRRENRELNHACRRAETDNAELRADYDQRWLSQQQQINALQTAMIELKSALEK